MYRSKSHGTLFCPHARQSCLIPEELSVLHISDQVKHYFYFILGQIELTIPLARLNFVYELVRYHLLP
jgi:hypothetical protein